MNRKSFCLPFEKGNICASADLQAELDVQYCIGDPDVDGSYSFNNPRCMTLGILNIGTKNDFEVNQIIAKRAIKGMDDLIKSSKEHEIQRQYNFTVTNQITSIHALIQKGYSFDDAVSVAEKYSVSNGWTDPNKIMPILHEIASAPDETSEDLPSPSKIQTLTDAFKADTRKLKAERQRIDTTMQNLRTAHEKNLREYIGAETVTNRF